MNLSRDDIGAASEPRRGSSPGRAVLLLLCVIAAIYPIAQLILMASGIVALPSANTGSDTAILLTNNGPFGVWLRDASLTALAVGVLGVSSASTIAYAISRSAMRRAGSTVRSTWLVSHLIPAALLMAAF